MTLLLPLTDAAITDCRDHFSQHPNIDPAISAYLTRHVNGLMCTEIERTVTQLIRGRLEKGCSDTATSNFLKSLRRNFIRNAAFSEIKDKMGFLGAEYKDKFNDLVDQAVGQDGINKLGLAVGKRNENAHENPPNITFRELEEAFSVATEIVEAVRTALDSQI